MSPHNRGALWLLFCLASIIATACAHQSLQIVPQVRPQEDLVLRSESGSHELTTSVPVYTVSEISEVHSTYDIALKVRGN